MVHVLKKVYDISDAEWRAYTSRWTCEYPQIWEDKYDPDLKPSRVTWVGWRKDG